MTDKEKAFAVNRIKQELAFDELIEELDKLDAKDLEEFCSENEIDGIRFCDKCGGPIIEGYSCFGGAYCSLVCLEMSEEEYNDQYDENEDCAFWTEWEA